MALRKEELAARPDNLNLTPRTQVAEGENDSCCLYMCISRHMHTHTLT